MYFVVFFQVFIVLLSAPLGNIQNFKSTLEFPDDVEVSKGAKSIIRGFINDA